jgi:DNA-binding transcriptional regulator YhcF (GntR family)
VREAASLVVDRRTGEPVYQQIAAQIRRLVASGALEAGEFLPGVRTVASDLGVNLNTVARAYRLLEEEGFVVIRSRSGVEVARPASSPSAAEREALREDLRAVLARLRQAGLGREEIARLAAKEVGSLARRPRGREGR